MKLIYKFNEKASPKISEVGGKAYSLIKMSQANFPVPDGFVLSVEFFKPWFKQVENMDSWKSFLKADKDKLKNQCDAIKKECKSLKLSNQQKKEIKEAMKEFKKENIFAVRSSSPEEDLEGKSFAGGYETSLGVTQKSLERAILHSFISLFDERIVKYKMQHGMKTHAPRIAIIVQEQIASDVSGVAFSLNPQNNCYDEVVINSSFGLGETIVSGQVTPDSFIVDKPKNKIIDKQIGHKDTALWLGKTGGIIKKDIKKPNKLTLTDVQVKAVAKLVGNVENYFEKPIDIEWAYVADELYLLQARPITTYVPLPEVMITKPEAEKYLYLDNIVLTQGISEPLSVLGNEIFGKLVEGDEGMIDRGMDGTLLNVDGRQYIHLSNLIKGFGAGIVPQLLKTYDNSTRTVIESIDLKKDYLPAKRPKAMRGLMWDTIKSTLGMIPGVVRAILNPAKALEAYQKQFARDVQTSKNLAVQDKNFQKLVDELMRHLMSHVNANVAILIPSMIARWRIKRMFKNDDVEDLRVALEMDLPGNPTSEMGHLMFKLAQFPEIRETKTGEDFEAMLNAKTVSLEFEQAYTDYMDKYGCRCIKEIDIATPRPYENIPAFFRQLKAIDVENNLIASVTKRRNNAYKKLLALATKKGQANKFKKLATTHQNLAGYRESLKYLFIIITDLLRQKALMLGKEFTSQGRLDDIVQIFDLTVQQITQAQQDTSLDLRAIVKKNLAPRKKVSVVREWPSVIDSRGKIFRAKRAPTKAGEVAGDPIAPGVARGLVKVLHNPYEKPLEKGDILVTRATNPGWTPLFMNASAVVLEVGGALQHGAIIAREYGLPCVSGIEGATSRFKDGQLIEVNGSDGIIRIINEDTQTY
jgi:pyruvate,water dikinase